VVDNSTHPTDPRVRKESMMVTPKVNETKRGSAHKAAGAAAQASTPSPPH
jgi:hypothetical protein